MASNQFSTGKAPQDYWAEETKDTVVYTALLAQKTPNAVERGLFRAKALTANVPSRMNVNAASQQQGLGVGNVLVPEVFTPGDVMD